MKRLILIALAIMFCLIGKAESWTDANGTIWNFSISGSNATITQGIGGAIPDEDLVIPSTVYVDETAYTVTSIGEYAFCNSDLTSIEIPEGITFIGQSAFGGCYKLQSLHIKDLKKWLQIHFENDSSYPLSQTNEDVDLYINNTLVTDLSIPEGITTIPESAFAHCSKLTSVSIPNGFTCIRSRTFYRCSNLTSINIPQGVTSIEHEVFEDCKSLTAITLPAGVIRIGARAFANCSDLVSINLPPEVTYIGESAFGGCSSLKSITVPNGVTEIESGTFGSCSSLTSINLPTGVTSIGKSAFHDCYDLTSITIPTGVTSIKEETFLNCTNLTSINIPEGVTEIGARAFWCCCRLTSINIPEGVTDIKDETFEDCSRLTSIHLPEGVTRIGDRAFRGCSNLTSINIPEGLTKIGDQAFVNCHHLLYIHFSPTTPLWSSSYWDNCSNVIFFVPNNAVDAYKSAWPDYTVVIVPESSFTNVYNVTTTAQEDKSDLIEKIGEDNALNVVKLKVSGTINSYDMMVIRNKMINLLELDLEDASIVANDYEYYQGCSSENDVFGDYFLCDTKIVSVVLPTTVTRIGRYAFFCCQYLCSISNYSNITEVGECAFSHCSELSDFTFPRNLIHISGAAFQDCRSLTSVQLSPQTTSIGNASFVGCSGLTEFRLPPYLQTIEESAFGNCDNLKDIYAYMVDVPAINTNTFNNHKHQTLYVPEFLYNKYYYDTNWSQFLNVRVCDLQVGDYETLYAGTSDAIFEEGVERIPGEPDAEVGAQGGIIVEGGEPQYFDEVEQNTDDEGHGGSLIGTNSNLIVNKLKLKLQVKANEWIGFNFPYDVTIADCEYPGQYVWIEYDGEARANGNSGWKVVTGEKLTANKGYMFMSSAKGKLIVAFDHPSFGGDKEKPLQSYTSGNAANAGWNFIGNPYSSYYALDENDFSAPITIWNGISYEAYRPGDDDIHLQPYQAFFVQMPQHVYVVNFDKDNQETYTQSQQTQANQAKTRKVAGIKPERLLINLTISDNDETTVDKTRLVLNEKASRDYELECDAAKFISDKAEAQLYMLENGVQMAIDERPAKGDICLGYMAKQAGKLRIEATRMDMPMVLVDTKTHQTFDLSLGNYEFETEAGTYDKRFMLRLSEEATAIKSLTAKTGVAVGLQDGGLSFGGAEGKSISIYNANGMLMTQQSGNGFVSLPSGLYLVKVDEISAKIYVK